MVKRYTLGKNREQVAQRFGIKTDINYKPVFNAAPQMELPIITSEATDKLCWYRWGLMPYDSVDAHMGDKLLNARIETIKAKRPFADLISSKRCIVPADGFFLWQDTDGKSTPYLFKKDHDALFGIAGIWDSWKDEFDENITFSTFSIITVESPDNIKSINERMPAIIPEEFEKNWLSKSFKTKDIAEVLKPQHGDLYTSHIVSDKVNDERNNTREVLRRIDGINPGDNLSLFAD